MKTPAGEIAAGAIPSFAKLIVLSLHLVKRFFPPWGIFFLTPRHHNFSFPHEQHVGKEKNRA